MGRHSQETVSSTIVPYGDGLYFRCHAVTDFDNPYPVNFLDYFDEQEAKECLQEYSEEAASQILAKRNEPIGGAIPFDSSHLSAMFVTDKLGMEPVGRLVMVESMPEHDYSGITSYDKRIAYVVKDKVFQAKYPEGTSNEEADAYNYMRSALVGAHELTHLAGAQDRIFFTIGKYGKIADIRLPGSTLENWPNSQRDNYIEEGFASLVGGAFIWQTPGLRESNRSVPFQSPSGIRINLPERHEVIGRQAHAIAGWGIERLVDAIPETWDVMLASRKYQVGWMVARRALKSLIDEVQPGLFNIIDTTDLGNLDNVFETTDRIIRLTAV